MLDEINRVMRQKIIAGNKIRFIVNCCLVLFSLSCDESDLPNDTYAPLEIGKPISIEYDSSRDHSFKDTYFKMDLAFYIPSGIETLRDRPLLFAVSASRNSSVAGSMLSTIEDQGMIAVSPLSGDLNQYIAVLEALIASDYIDSNEVYVAGFSRGGAVAFDLAWAVQDKVKGAILLDPAGIAIGDPVEKSRLSVCIVCQESRIDRYSPSVEELANAGISAKLISVEGTDHFGILSPYTEKEKRDCFEFVK